MDNTLILTADGSDPKLSRAEELAIRVRVGDDINWRRECNALAFDIAVLGQKMVDEWAARETEQNNLLR